ncbi:MAG: hypothetical protein AAGC55_08160 [Myxococcota bacterium]
MNHSLTLTELMQEHFDSVLSTIDHGRWGQWVLDRGLAQDGELVVTHEGAGYTVALATPTDWVAVVAGKEWATATDVGQLIFAIRDLEYARWLGVLPQTEVRATN